MANKLFIPGPTEVRKEVLEALATPQIGHRTEAFKKLFGGLKPGLQAIFFTNNDVLISTSSGSGFWEVSIRCCVNKRMLVATNGAFSKKYADVGEACAREVERIKYDYGKAVKPEDVDKALAKGGFEAFGMAHNETSTGVTSNMEEIAEVMKKYPDVLWFVDAVSSLGGIKLEVDKLGIDICFTSSQKAFAMPPGLSMASVSPRCYEKAKEVPGKGYYFNILDLKKEYDTDQTPYTPSIPHLYALEKQLGRIMEEGIENRFRRHAEMAEYTRGWAAKHGMLLFSEEGYHSNTVTCLLNTRNLDMKKIKKEMSAQGYSIDTGYGKLNEKLEAEGKPTTFRIAHMGDLTLAEIKELTAALDPYMGG
ncbi:MAG: alanine--glyoxylate aminotransferase family protein [Coprothermobacterota bacterium]|nr:alanine--glyoxylate aminotransferase family protein [Coprothermobacterota bacterium]